MSGTETEPTTEPTEPTEPAAEPTEPTEPTPQPEPTEPTQPDEGQSLDAQREEQDETWNTLGKKGKNYATAVVTILKESPLPLAVCDMCADSIPGFRHLQPQDELRAQLVSVVEGAAALDELEEDPDVERCPTCRGKGALRLPTDVPGNKARGCKRCNGAGYMERHPESGSLIASAPPTANGQTEQYQGVPTEDPAVADLIARGYMVVPPVNYGAPSE